MRQRALVTGGTGRLVPAEARALAERAFAELGLFVTQAAAPALREARGAVVMIEDVAGYQPLQTGPSADA
jgi:NAD(P)-dependent dehydrogenase (short-subunit alcohol dehydrogenase family)